MILSDEQAHAVHHGLKPDPTWEEIERPTGHQPLPDWLRDVNVHWYDGYANPPHVTIKTIGEHWPNPIFRKEGDAYVAEHPDGRLHIHWHSGKVARQTIKVFRSADGTIRQEPRWGVEWGDSKVGLAFINPDGSRIASEPGEWIEAEMRCTTQQEGYGGRHFWLMMDDGDWLILRGPWRGGVPDGWTAMHTVACDKPDRYDLKRPWFQRTACYGTEIRNDIYIAALSRFAAHLPLARVTYRYGTFIEPYNPEWGEPKHFWLERRRASAA